LLCGDCRHLAGSKHQSFCRVNAYVLLTFHTDCISPFCRFLQWCFFAACATAADAGAWSPLSKICCCSDLHFPLQLLLLSRRGRRISNAYKSSRRFHPHSRPARQQPLFRHRPRSRDMMPKRARPKLCNLHSQRSIHRLLLHSFGLCSKHTEQCFKGLWRARDSGSGVVV